MGKDKSTNKPRGAQKGTQSPAESSQEHTAQSSNYYIDPAFIGDKMKKWLVDTYGSLLEKNFRKIDVQYSDDIKESVTIILHGACGQLKEKKESEKALKIIGLKKLETAKEALPIIGNRVFDQTIETIILLEKPGTNDVEQAKNARDAVKSIVEEQYVKKILPNVLRSNDKKEWLKKVNINYKDINICIGHDAPANINIDAKTDQKGKFIILSLLQYGDDKSKNQLKQCLNHGLSFLQNDGQASDVNRKDDIAVLCLMVTKVQGYSLPIVTCVPNIMPSGQIVKGERNNATAAHAEEISCFMVHNFLQSQKESIYDSEISMYYHLFTDIQAEKGASTPCPDRCKKLPERMMSIGYKQWRPFRGLADIRNVETISGRSQTSYLELSIFSAQRTCEELENLKNQDLWKLWDLDNHREWEQGH